MEFEEMVTMDHGAGVDDDGERPDCRYVAWLLREKLNDLVDGDQGEPPELELRSLLNLVASRKIVSVDPKMLNPVLWRTLPKELLLLVFARLPLPDITRLRSLSREWNRDVATLNSEINRACDETTPIVFAGFSWGKGSTMCEATFLVTICTQRSQYSYCLHPGDPVEGRWDDMGAMDGGLVCFVSTCRLSKANPLCIVVVNLLTGIRRKLPPLKYVYLTPPKMVHIEVDSETKCYRVVVLGKNIKGRPTVEIYDSGARQWTKATPPHGFIFGLAHSWEYNIFPNWGFRSTSITRSVYNFAEGQLKCFDEEDHSEAASAITYAFQKDCMFVLRKNTSSGEFFHAEGYCITKYRLQTNAKDWVQERSYLCSPLEDLSEEDYSLMTLEGCEGFLMMFPDSSGNCARFWLLDLSSGEWSSLPYCFQGHEFSALIYTRVFWNVVP